MESKEKILVLIDDFYPSSRATSYIMQNILSKMVKNTYIEVITLNILQMTKPEESVYNGIKFSPAQKLLPKKRNKIMAIKEKIFNLICILKTGVKYEYGVLYSFSKVIAKYIRKNDFTKIISVASPMQSHVCASLVCKKTDTQWYPISFDPHAYNQRLSAKIRKRMLKEEKIIYKKAKKIFFLEQSRKDYLNSKFKDKIVYFNLPIDFKNYGNYKNDSLKDKIVCSFIGNLYYDIRNPEYLLNVLYQVVDDRIFIRFIGDFIGDFPANYFVEWEKKFNNKIEFLPRVSRSEVNRYIADSDILLNIGNISTNQCPSKLLEYIGCGKPIIHVKKMDYCTSLPYLKKYPLKLIIDESQSITNELVDETRTFIVESKGGHIDSNILQGIYNKQTYEYNADLLLKEMDIGK